MCTARSRVGTIIKAWHSFKVILIRCSSGMVNIIVLPLPGPDKTMMSRPFKQCTITRCCKPVGLTKPSE